MFPANSSTEAALLIKTYGKGRTNIQRSDARIAKNNAAPRRRKYRCGHTHRRSETGRRTHQVLQRQAHENKCRNTTDSRQNRMNINNVIIVAGGKGLRMGSDLPKQFIPINGRPVLMHTIEAFHRFDPAINIILVIPADHKQYWQELTQKYSFTLDHKITEGGLTRFHSVKNGLDLVTSGLVAVHDGVRPFVSANLIKACFDAASIYKAAIPVVDVTDSLRVISDDGKSRIIDRTKIKQVQTPQVFDVETLKNAYQAIYSDTFTDDASVVEAMGTDIYLVKGEDTNIKITRPFDLKIGELIMNSK